MGFNGDDSHPNISSKSLIKGEEADQMAKPKVHLFIPMFFDEKSILECFKQSNYFDILIIEYLALFFF